MFFRRKRSGRTEYLQIVKNERVDGQPRQSVVATFGRVDELAQDGTLDRLLRSGARFAHSAVVLTAYAGAVRNFVRGGRLKQQSDHGHCEALAEQDGELGL